MFKNPVVLLFATILICITFSVQADARPNSYQMVCRKGPGMSLSLLATKKNKIAVELTFKRGTQKAGLGNSKMGPGECAFINRPVLKTEPNRLVHSTDVAVAVRIPLSEDKNPYLWVPHAGSDKRKGQAMNDLKVFFNGINSKEYFTVDAYRFAAGERWDRFEITKFR